MLVTTSNFPSWVTDLATIITIFTFMTGAVTVRQLFERRSELSTISPMAGYFLRLIALPGFLILVIFLLLRPGPRVMPPSTPVTASRRAPSDRPSPSSAQNTASVYSVVPSGGTQPVEVHRPAPLYPTAAHRAGLEGQVVLRGIVRSDGSISSVELIRGLDPVLDESALQAFRQWRFQPATYLGKPIDVYYTVTVNFRLGQR